MTILLLANEEKWNEAAERLGPVTLKACGGNKEERELLVAEISDLSFASGKAKLPKGSEFQLLYFRVYVFLKICIFIKHPSRFDTSQEPLHEMLQIDCSILETKTKLYSCCSSCCGVLLWPFVTFTNSLKVCS